MLAQVRVYMNVIEDILHSLHGSIGDTKGTGTNLRHFMDGKY